MSEGSDISVLYREFADALTVNLAHQYGWRVAVCSFENPPAEHIAKLAEKHLGLPFWDGPRQRMTEAELQKAMTWAADHFHLIRFDDEAPTIDAILEKARVAVMRHGIRGLVIDPYNEIEHHRPASVTETEYVSQLLGKVKRFAQSNDVHVWFVAHPAKMQREGNSLPLIFEDADGTVRNTFTYDPATQSWTSLIVQKAKGGDWKTFAEDRLKRP